MNKKVSPKRKAENEQIEKLRTELEKLLSEPEYKEISKTFRHVLAQRLGVKEIPESGLLLTAPAPISKQDLIKAKMMRPGEPGPIWPDGPYSYANLYSYSFW